MEAEELATLFEVKDGCRWFRPENDFVDDFTFISGKHHLCANGRNGGSNCALIKTEEPMAEYDWVPGSVV